jgi:TonB family protein
VSRLADLDHLYRRRMGLALPVAAAAIWALQLLHPLVSEFSVPKRVGRPGPLRLLPEIDIVPEQIEESHLTAAPLRAAPSDFLVLEVDYTEVPRREPRPVPEPAPSPEPEEKVEPVSSSEDLVMEAVRTTGHPVLAEVDYQLLYWQRPVYPPEAVAAGIEGNVDVMMLVNTHGRVSRVVVVNPDQHPLLEQAVTQAVSKSRFRAYVVNGKPTPFWVRVPVEFRIVN